MERAPRNKTFERAIETELVRDGERWYSGCSNFNRSHNGEALKMASVEAKRTSYVFPCWSDENLREAATFRAQTQA